ncbi:MAG: DUF4268 domain-containing protein [Anaerolinea sp.]|nr:DUF4268 domain-containing protein [Anaerolinea sp.]
MKPIARLTRVPLRVVWHHEALNFTRWLAENLDLLSELTGLHLLLVQTEAAAGDFAVDILAEDENGNQVVIENQLDRTDHDHLGKLITYMSNHDAKTAIWITSQPRPEHEKAVHWLNETLPDDTSFYLLQVEAVRIDDSPPAPLFTVIAGPSAESRRIGEQRKELAHHHILCQEFWQGLLTKAKQKSTVFANISPSKGQWVSAGAGKSGVTWAYVVLMDHARVELYIDTLEVDKNKRYFDALLKHKNEIEASFGAPLEWQRLDQKRASRIAYLIHGHGGLPDQENWDALQDAMIDAMARLEAALKTHFARL